MKIGNLAVKITSTFFYIGYLPFIPGTFGSLAGLALYYFVKDSMFAYVLLVLILAILGFLSAGRAEKVFQMRDPKYVVIDEVVGMLLSLMFLPYDIKLVVSGFFLFRLLDTLKPFPIGRLERLDGSKGIMGDDIMAGLYANIVLQVVFRLTSFTAS